MAFYTPLRYPGGKRKLIKFMKNLLVINNLKKCHYIEPYAGGAGLALQLLFEEHASCIHINDLNASIYSFWYAVLNNTDNFCRLIQDTPITIGEWHRQKAIQSHAEDLSGSLELAFSTFFLNRTNRSGIIKGGVIGGKNQSGEWKLSARFSKSNLINRIQRIANRRDQITLSRMDAVEFLKVFQHKKDSEPYFFYLDPPYYEKGAGLYDNFYQPEDHSILANYIQKLEYPWIISYDNVPEVRKLYSDYRAITYSLNYTAQTKEVGHEFMAFSNGLTLPNDIRQKKSSFGCMRDVIAVNWN